MPESVETLGQDDASGQTMFIAQGTQAMRMNSANARRYRRTLMLYRSMSIQVPLINVLIPARYIE